MASPCRSTGASQKTDGAGLRIRVTAAFPQRRMWPGFRRVSQTGEGVEVTLPVEIVERTVLTAARFSTNISKSRMTSSSFQFCGNTAYMQPKKVQEVTKSIPYLWRLWTGTAGKGYYPLEVVAAKSALAVERQAADRALDRVGIDLDAAVVEEPPRRSCRPWARPRGSAGTRASAPRRSAWSDPGAHAGADRAAARALASRPRRAP